MSYQTGFAFAREPTPIAGEPTSESDEFYTPHQIVDALPPIDLDPFSPPHRPVPAGSHCVGDEGGDGFAIDWRGVVWCNPPYSRGNLPRFGRKARDEVEAGRASIVIGLIPAKPGSNYWHDHILGRAVVGYVRGRIAFQGRDGQPFRDSRGHIQRGKFDSAFVLWSNDAELVARVMSDLDARSGLVIYWSDTHQGDK